MLTIHVWPRWVKEFLLTHPLYKSPRCFALEFHDFHHLTPNDTAKRPKISTRNKFDNIATPMRPTKSSSRNDS